LTKAARHPTYPLASNCAGIAAGLLDPTVSRAVRAAGSECFALTPTPSEGEPEVFSK